MVAGSRHPKRLGKCSHEPEMLGQSMLKTALVISMQAGSCCMMLAAD